MADELGEVGETDFETVFEFGSVTEAQLYFTLGGRQPKPTIIVECGASPRRDP
jgi:hypothetical protein